MYKGSDDYYMLFHKIQTNAIKRERIERIQVLYLAYIIYVHVPTWCKTSLYKNIHQNLSVIHIYEIEYDTTHSCLYIHLTNPLPIYQISCYGDLEHDLSLYRTVLA